MASCLTTTTTSSILKGAGEEACVNSQPTWRIAALHCHNYSFKKLKTDIALNLYSWHMIYHSQKAARIYNCARAKAYKFISIFKIHIPYCYSKQFIMKFLEHSPPFTHVCAYARLCNVLFSISHYISQRSFGFQLLWLNYLSFSLWLWNNRSTLCNSWKTVEIETAEQINTENSSAVWHFLWTPFRARLTIYGLLYRGLKRDNSIFTKYILPCQRRAHNLHN